MARTPKRGYVLFDDPEKPEALEVDCAGAGGDAPLCKSYEDLVSRSTPVEERESSRYLVDYVAEDGINGLIEEVTILPACLRFDSATNRMVPEFDPLVSQEQMRYLWTPKIRVFMAMGDGSRKLVSDNVQDYRKGMPPSIDYAKMGIAVTQRVVVESDGLEITEVTVLPAQDGKYDHLLGRILLSDLLQSDRPCRVILDGAVVRENLHDWRRDGMPGRGVTRR
jgi:hypothetical protein